MKNTPELQVATATTKEGLNTPLGTNTAVQKNAKTATPAHRVGELPGQKPSPAEQNRKPILTINKQTKRLEILVDVDKVDHTIYCREICHLLGLTGWGQSNLLVMSAGL